MALIKGVFCAYPRTYINKDDMAKLFQHSSFNYPPEKQEKIEKIISTMNIQTRPTCVDFKQFWTDLDSEKCPCTVERPSPENLFRGAKEFFNPTLGERATVWQNAVKELSLRAAKGLLVKTRTPPEDIECVIANTSTGVMLPNLSTWLPQQLKLTNIKCNYSLDNTGCGGAITCLDVARNTILSGRAGVVLVVTVDCSSPHMNVDAERDMEGILPNLLFGDGAGAILVTKETDPVDPGCWRIEEPRGILLSEETADHISMKLTESCYSLTLSKDLVPALMTVLGTHWKGVIEEISKSRDTGSVEWLVHPGGRAIIDAFTKLSPPLSNQDLKYSNKVMRDRGNLVSATLVFVLDLMLSSNTDKKKACLVGPGPGLELKFMSLQRV